MAELPVSLAQNLELERKCSFLSNFNLLRKFNHRNNMFLYNDRMDVSKFGFLCHNPSPKFFQGFVWQLTFFIGPLFIVRWPNLESHEDIACLGAESSAGTGAGSPGD